MKPEGMVHSVIELADMGSSLLADGFAPVVLIGARVTDNDEIHFAVTVLPGVELDMLQALLTELAEQSAAGTFTLKRVTLDPD